MVLRTCNKIQNLGLQNIFPDNTRQCTNFSVYLKSYIALGTYNTQKQKESFQKQLIPCVRRKTLMRVQLSRVSYSVSGRNQIMCATFSYKQVAQNLFENLQIIKKNLIVFFSVEQRLATLPDFQDLPGRSDMFDRIIRIDTSKKNSKTNYSSSENLMMTSYGKSQLIKILVKFFVEQKI